MENLIDNQLWELQKACNRFEDKKAMWVLYAVSRYIGTARAGADFLKYFIAYSVEKCLT